MRHWSVYTIAHVVANASNMSWMLGFMLASMHLLRGFLEDPSWVAVPWKGFSGFASSCWRGATIRDRQRGDYFYGLRASLEARSQRLKLAWDRRTRVYTEKSTECMVHRKKHMYPVPWCMLVPNEFVPCHDPPIDRCVVFEYLANAIWRKGSGEGLKGSNVFWTIFCKYSVCWYNNMLVFFCKNKKTISAGFSCWYFPVCSYGSNVVEGLLSKECHMLPTGFMWSTKFPCLAGHPNGPHEVPKKHAFLP